MKIKEIIEKTGKYVLNTYGRRPIAFENGEGATVYDTDGNPFLDFNSGLGVNALGHVHPLVKKLIIQQAGKVIHTSNLYHIPAQADLAEKICGKSFGDRVFFCNSGAEAVEGALKFARKWGKTFSEDKVNIVAFKNSFHGRTFGAVTATRQAKYHNGFEPLLPGITEAVFNDLASVDKMVDNNTAAIIIEPIQGEGGVNIADPAFIAHLEKVCRANDALIIVDEVQCGLARSGKLFTYEHYGLTPDIMTLAKPLAGGLPIGAVVVGPKVTPLINPGDHASTFGGNHFVTGVANGVWDILSKPAFVDDVMSKGEKLFARLSKMKKKYPSIVDVRGKGLMIGIEVDFPASEVVDYYEKEGILICSAGPNVIRFIPPLIVTVDEIERVVKTLESFLDER